MRGAGLSTGVCISDQLYKQNLGGAIATSMSGKDKGKDKEQRKEMQEKEKKERRKKETDSGCWISLRFSNSQGTL